jgi:hypothetical protein
MATGIPDKSHRICDDGISVFLVLFVAAAQTDCLYVALTGGVGWFCINAVGSY